MLLHICTNSLLIILFCCIGKSENKNIDFNDICGVSNGKRFYLDFGESGSLSAKYENHLVDNNESDKKFGFRKNNTDSKRNNKCSVEFITCPSCVIHVKFRFLNISRNCGKSSVFDSCGCDYVLITEPPFEDASGEQFCGRFIPNNVSEIRYNSQTRTVAINFIFSNDYGHAFTVDYSSERNRIHLNGHPKMNNMNNASQIISSPFFPNWYPPDLSVEYLINCWSTEPCRISLVFTDFLVADASILEFFDWNGQRIYVRNGNIFRPPVIISSGPSLIVRFYANGASDFGFKATYSFILGNLDDSAFKPDIACGGHVNNLGGGITMMNMVSEGTKYFDCIWIVKPPGSYLHRKTHLYVKVVTFDDFAGTTEMVIRQGITSNEPSIEVFRFPFSHFNGVSRRQDLEHVVPLNQGFYISLKGLFRKESRLTIVYAAFNYKDCYSGSDFLCHNLRCIPLLLNCDGFDHCGDNSDESPSCSQDPMDHRQFSQIPNFLFPKMEPYSDMTAASLVFLICTFGCVGIIFAVGLLLYRVNLKARHQRQIQDHLETIHAILEEGVGGMEEEIIIPDDPPDYEPPPEYADVIRLQKYMESMASKKQQNKRCRCSTMKQPLNIHLRNIVTPESPTSIQSTSFLIQNESIPLNRSESCSTNDISCNTIIEHPLSDNVLEHPTNENDTQEESSSVVEQTKFNNKEALTSEENVSQTMLEESPKSINECTYCNLTDPCTSNTANLECSNNPEEDICRPSTSCADSVETSTKNTTGENNSSCSECSSSTSLEHSNKARFISVPVKRNFSAAISRPPGTIIQVCKRSKSCQTTPIRTIAIPDSPPPAYEQIDRKRFQEFEEAIGESLEYVEENCGSAKEEEGNDAPISSTDSSDLQQSFPKNPFILAQHSTLNISETCVTKMSCMQEFKNFSESIQNNVKNCKSTTKLIKSFVSRSDEYLHNNSCSEYGINCKNTFREKNLYKKCYSADNIYKL